MSSKNAVSANTRLFEESDHAALYLKCRPDWPEEVIQKSLAFLHEKRPKPFTLAVDIGCGSGQSTRPLASYFDTVIGVDVSDAQIITAQSVDNPPNVEFRTATAESLPVPDNSVDLITCAEAVHWFDLDAFFQEVDRVLRPCGCVAIYAYHNIQPWVDGEDVTNQKVKDVVTHLDTVTLEAYSSHCSRHLQNMLADIHIPYSDSIRIDSLDIRQDTTMAAYMGYIRSWSNYQTYVKKSPDNPDPLKEVQERLMAILGLDSPAEDAKIHVRSPVVLLLGRKPEK